MEAHHKQQTKNYENKNQNICKQICKNYKNYMYCEEKLSNTWVYVIIQDKETNLYYYEFNTDIDFCVYDLKFNTPTLDRIKARNYICRAMRYSEM